jgi:hypothetical protein
MAVWWIRRTIYLWLYSPLLDLGRFYRFLIMHTVGKSPWTGEQPVAKPLTTYRPTQTQNKRTKTSMPCVRFDPMIPAFKWAKTVHSLDLAVTVIAGSQNYTIVKNVSALRITGILDLIDRTVFQRTHSFGNWIRCRPQVRGGRHTLMDLLERANVNHWHLGTGTGRLPKPLVL